MLKTIRILFFYSFIFFVTAFSAHAIDENWQTQTEQPLYSSENQPVYQTSAISHSTGSNQNSSISSEQYAAQAAAAYSNFVTQIEFEAKAAQQNGGVEGLADLTSQHLDSLQGLISAHDSCKTSACSQNSKMPGILKLLFEKSEESIRAKLEDIKSYAATHILQTDHLSKELPETDSKGDFLLSAKNAALAVSGSLGLPESYKEGAEINIPNSTIIPIWMNSVEQHFANAVAQQSALEYQRGMKLLDTVVFQKNTRQHFLYKMDLLDLFAEQVCRLPEHEDQPEHVDESRLARFNRRIEQAQAIVDAASPLDPVFNWIHKGVTGVYLEDTYSQDYWDTLDKAETVVHTGLDAAGSIPVIGEGPDAYNALLYASEGEWLDAGLSAAGTVPAVGSAATGSRYADNAVGLASIGGKYINGTTRVVSNKTVLGKYPDYLRMADKIGANRFDVPKQFWNKMSENEQWIANKKFLDRMINRGDKIILSNPVKNINDVNGAFKKELDYLIKRGFVLSADGTRMIKP